MPFKSDTQPLCRFCGKPIAKRTIRHYFGKRPDYCRRSDWSVDHVEQPATMADAQRLINEQIVSVRRDRRRMISDVGAWDGESYVDEFFCKGECARRFGYAMARNEQGFAAQPYWDALKARS